MDKELSKRWLKLPEIQVEGLNNMLLVNKRFVSLPDITPEVLSDYIEIGQESIDTRMLEMRQDYRHWGDAGRRPMIMIGRLALSGREHRVFSNSGLLAGKDSDIDVDDLKEIYRGYWMAVEAALYKPEVSRNITLSNPALDGTWLGLRKY